MGIQLDKLTGEYQYLVLEDWQGVKAGFISNGFSIPRPVRFLFPDINRHLEQAIWHDAGYAGLLGLSRKQCDTQFRDRLIRSGYSVIKSYLVYIGVRLFGSPHYKG